MADFEEARDKIMIGLARRSKVIQPSEREIIAYHEAGHALLHYHPLNTRTPLHKVTIIPHGMALGVSFSLPENDMYTRGKGWLLDRITITMGGYAAEKLRYGETSTGAQNDIEQATELAHRMVCEWGMSETLGPVAYGQKEEPIFLGKEIARHKDYSEETARHIDQEVVAILSSRLQTATEPPQTQMTIRCRCWQRRCCRGRTIEDAEIRILLGFPERDGFSSGDALAEGRPA